FFSSPCAGLEPLCVGYGNEGRNSFVGPSFFGVDMSLFKNFKITERVNLQFRAESFNVFNHPNFQLPASPANRVNVGFFGQSAGTFNPRQWQFGLKMNF
ncbi:MAG TPA: hypothetical protein VL382_01290, partial [Terriglobales bacterium]|nr:hypothetical protein [Terriglobales bacterium]